MKCPTCPDAVLVMADRAGIEIDYCPTCRGVWLDRGELDKIIERSANQPATAPAAPPASSQPQPQQQWQSQGQPMPTQGNSKYHGKYHSKYHDPRGGSYPRKKKSFLGDLFEF